MNQCLNYGQYLRNIYSGFIDPIYNRSEVLIQSTDSDRTLQGAYALLAGLYPQNNITQRFDQSLDWQPIPVHTKSKESDNVRWKSKYISF